MKKREKQMASNIVELFKDGKLDFLYSYNPLFTFSNYDRRDDHEFVAEYQSLSIRLRRRRVMVVDKELQQTDRHFEPTVDFPHTRELKKIYGELYHKHKAEIEEVLNAQEDYNQKLHKPVTQDRDDDTTTILEKLKS